MEKGQIIFYNGNYGFIETATETNIFFLKKNIVKDSFRQNINFFDEVSFSLSTNKFGPHRGKKIATNINLLNHSTDSIHDRYLNIVIGTITSIESLYYIIQSSRLEKETVLYKTRLLYGKNLQIGDLCVFYPTKSIKPHWQYFAFLAYKLEHENNEAFLVQEFRHNEDVNIQDSIKKKLAGSNIFNQNNFQSSIILLEPIDSIDKFQNLTKLLEKYPEHRSYDSLKDRLIDDKYMILLWEEGIIDNYSLELMKEYFHAADANLKRNLSYRMREEHKTEVYKYHVDKLDEEYRFSRLNNAIKTILSIVNNNSVNRNQEVYEYIYDHIVEQLNHEELYELWIKGYIEEIEDHIVESSYNLNNLNEIKNLIDKLEHGNKIYTKILNYFEDKVLHFVIEDVTKTNSILMFPKYFYLYREIFPIEYSSIKDKLEKIFTNKHKFLLHVFRLVQKQEYEIDILSFINQYNINLFFGIILFKDQIINRDTLERYFKIDKSELVEFISSINWDSVIYPTKYDYYNNVTLLHFLPEIGDFLKDHEILGLDNIEILADVIYHRIPKYNVEHIRIWLEYFPSNKDYFKYTEYRTPYKYITEKEKSDFNDCSKKIQKVTEIEIITSRIKNCEYSSCEENVYFFKARMENFYFDDGQIDFYYQIDNIKDKISIEDRMSDFSYNLIISNKDYKNIPFLISLKLDKGNFSIIRHSGFDYLHLVFAEKSIEKTLGEIGKVRTLGEKRKNTIPYAEDWQLKQMILDYLNQNSERIEYVAEPKNFYHRLDDEAAPELYENTGLYIIDNDTDYIIVWENIDFSEDRATYIFKAKKVDIDDQIEKIKTAISTYAQYRSSLRKKITKDNNDLALFKNYFGYISVILKQRGKNAPFYNWERKLQLASEKLVPIVTSEDDWKKIENNTFVTNQPKVRHKTKPILPTRPKYIPDKDIATNPEDMPIPTIELEKTLDLLKELNEKLINTLR